MAYVYILRCSDDTLYTGSAKDLTARLQKHQNGTGARYTRGRRPVTLVWHTQTETWREALQKEFCIKRLTRRAKEQLIETTSLQER